MEIPVVLLADDDPAVAAVVARALEPAGCRLVTARSGADALAAAAAGRLDLVLLDVRMPGLSGWGVLDRLRRAPATRALPVVMLTGCGDLSEKVEGFGLGADDYVTKPFSLDELRARVWALLRRTRDALSSNPLTRLPGSPVVQREVERRLLEGEPFALMHADLDRFKAFNDAYGWARGDQALLAAAGALLRAVEAAGEPDSLVGHIGGDDFAVVCSEARAGQAAALAALAFDEAVPGLHDAADAARGWIERPGRSRVPLLSLSIGGATSSARGIACYAQAASLASESKTWLKTRRREGPSAWAFDRRAAEEAA